MPRKAAFIVLEGPDKSGKSTQASLLVRALQASGREVVHTREPGGTRFAEAIRKIVLDPRHRVHPLAELLLYEAARAQHVQERLLPALRAGKIVVCERFSLASLVYQGYARGLSLALVRAVDRVATAGLKPDLTIVLDVPDREFHRRDPSRRLDRLERESAGFRAKVRRGYRALARRLPKTALIDASLPPETVHRKVLEKASRAL